MVGILTMVGGVAYSAYSVAYFAIPAIAHILGPPALALVCVGLLVSQRYHRLDPSSAAGRHGGSNQRRERKQ